MAMILAFHGRLNHVQELRDTYRLSSRGMRLVDLANLARAVKFLPRAVSADASDFHLLTLPAILHWGGRHFVVLAKINEGGATIHDPSAGRVRLGWEQVRDRYSGVALIVAPTSPSLGIGKAHSRATESPTALAPALLGVVQGGAFALGTSVLGFELANGSKLNFQGFATVAIALGLFCASSGLGDWLAGRAGSSAVDRVVKDAEPWRRTSEEPVISSRLITVEAYARARIARVQSGAAGGLLLAWLYYGDARTGVWAISLVGIYAFICAFAGGSHLERPSWLERAADFQAKSILAGESLRSMSLLEPRKLIWRASFRRYVAADRMRFLRDAVLAGIANLLLGSGILAAWWFGHETQEARITWTIGLIGVVFFARGATASLSPKHPENDDFSRTAVQQRPSALRAVTPHLLELRGVGFAYGEPEGDLFSNLNFTIELGELAVIFGPMGVGKSTLLKIMAGAIDPDKGERLLRQTQELNSSGPCLAYVEQEDTLLPGTIAQNIAFFTDQIDTTKVIDAARRAGLEATILEMPMKYATSVGSRGCYLSSRQRRRLMIARALYRDAELLILDEPFLGTDDEGDRELVNLLTSLPVARVVVTASPVMRARADRIYELRAGRLILETSQIVEDA